MAKDILKSSISYTILGFLPLSFAFLFTPIYLNYLDKEEYGLLNLFVLYSGIIAQVYAMGVSSAFGYIYWDVYKDGNELKKLISSTLGLLLIFQVLFISIGILFGDGILGFLVKSSDKFTFSPFLITSLFFSAFMVYYEMFLYFFRNEGKLKQYATLSISTLILLTLGTLYGVVWLDWKAIGAIWGRTFGYGIVVVLFFIYIASKYGISFDFKRSKSLLIFSIPLFINSLVGAFSYGVDRLIIERFDNLENFGVYAFALIIITVIEIWFNALNNALSPTLYKFIHESINEKKKEIRILSNLIIISVLLLITAIIALIHPVFHILIPENFHQAALYIPILAIAFIWRVMTTLTSYSIYSKKKTKLLLINQSSYLLAIVILGYIGYNLFGMLGIAYAVYLAKVIEFIIMNRVSNRIKKLPFKLKNLILLSILISISSFACAIFNPYIKHTSILYLLPLLCLLVFSPLIIRVELRNVIYAIKNRKSIL